MPYAEPPGGQNLRTIHVVVCLSVYGIGFVAMRIMDYDYGHCFQLLFQYVASSNIMFKYLFDTSLFSDYVVL